MKVYKAITSGRHIMEFNGAYHLLATPNLSQSLYFTGPTFVKDRCNEVNYEDIKYLEPHFPKIIKKELGILN